MRFFGVVGPFWLLNKIAEGLLEGTCIYGTRRGRLSYGRPRAENKEWLTFGAALFAQNKAVPEYCWLSRLVSRMAQDKGPSVFPMALQTGLGEAKAVLKYCWLSRLVCRMARIEGTSVFPIALQTVLGDALIKGARGTAPSYRTKSERKEGQDPPRPHTGAQIPISWKREFSLRHHTGRFQSKTSRFRCVPLQNKKDF